MHSMIPLRYRLPDLPDIDIDELLPFSEVLQRVEQASVNYRGADLSSYQCMLVSLSVLSERWSLLLQSTDIPSGCDSLDPANAWQLFDAFAEGCLLLRAYWGEPVAQKWLTSDLLRAIRTLEAASLHPFYWALVCGLDQKTEPCKGYERDKLKETKFARHLERLSSPTYIPDTHLEEIRAILSYLLEYDEFSRLSKIESILTQSSSPEPTSLLALKKSLDEALIFILQSAFSLAKADCHAVLGLLSLLHRHWVDHLDTEYWKLQYRIEKSQLEPAASRLSVETIRGSDSFSSDLPAHFEQGIWGMSRITVFNTVDNQDKGLLGGEIHRVLEDLWLKCESLLDQMLLFRAPRSKRATVTLKTDALMILKSALAPFAKRQLMHHIITRWRSIVLVEFRQLDRLVALILDQFSLVLAYLTCQAEIQCADELQ